MGMKTQLPLVGIILLILLCQSGFTLFSRIQSWWSAKTAGGDNSGAQLPTFDIDHSPKLYRSLSSQTIAGALAQRPGILKTRRTRNHPGESHQLMPSAPLLPL